MPAYNNFFPATYSPYGQGFFQNPYGQQIIPQMQPTQISGANQPQPQNQPQVSGIIWVNGNAEADAYPIAPNNAVTLWDRNRPVVYFKQADASGKPSMKVYDLVERTETQSLAQDVKSYTETKNLNYATLESVTALEESVDKLRNELKAVKRELKKRESEAEDE